MAREEARIFTSIWDDPAFLELDGDAQRLFMFLLSQKDLSYCGVIALRPPRWAKKAQGLTVEAVEKALLALEADPGPFAIVDYETCEVLVRSFIRRDGLWKQPNLLKRAIEEAQLVESARIRCVLASELRRLPLDESPSKQVKTLVARFIQELEVASPMPLLYPTANPSGNPSDEGSCERAAQGPDEGSGKDYTRAREYGEGNGSSGETLLTPGTLTPTPPTPPAAPSRDRQRGTRLPEDFAVTAEMVTWFRQECPHVDGRRETERFCDHWWSKPGKDGRKLDWIRTWKNWMRTAEDRAMPRTRAAPSLPPPAPEHRRSEIARLREEEHLRLTGVPPESIIQGSVVA